MGSMSRRVVVKGVKLVVPDLLHYIITTQSDPSST